MNERGDGGGRGEAASSSSSSLSPPPPKKPHLDVPTAALSPLKKPSSEQPVAGPSSTAAPLRIAPVANGAATATPAATPRLSPTKCSLTSPNTGMRQRAHSNGICSKSQRGESSSPEERQPLTAHAQSSRSKIAAKEKFTPREDLVTQIMDMGICRNGAVKALYWTGNHSALAASNWIFDQPDRDLDTPLEDELEMIRAQQAEREREERQLLRMCRVAAQQQQQEVNNHHTMMQHHHHMHHLHHHHHHHHNNSAATNLEEEVDSFDEDELLLDEEEEEEDDELHDEEEDVEAWV